jgi:hypothetical protein
MERWAVACLSWKVLAFEIIDENDLLMLRPSPPDDVIFKNLTDQLLGQGALRNL